MFSLRCFSLPSSTYVKVEGFYFLGFFPFSLPSSTYVKVEGFYFLGFFPVFMWFFKSKNNAIKKTTSKMLQVIGTQYQGSNQYGDFNFMINSSDFANALFIFNDNEEDHNSNRRGGGNASI